MPKTPTREALEQRITAAQEELNAIDAQIQQAREEITHTHMLIGGIQSVVEESSRHETHAHQRLEQAQQSHEQAIAAYTRPEFGAVTLAHFKDQLKASEGELARVHRETEQRLADMAQSRERLAAERLNHEAHIADLNEHIQTLITKSNAVATQYREDVTALGELLYAQHAPLVEQTAQALHEAHTAEAQAKQHHADALHAHHKAREEAMAALQQWPQLKAQIRAE